MSEYIKKVYKLPYMFMESNPYTASLIYNHYHWLLYTYWSGDMLLLKSKTFFFVPIIGSYLKRAEITRVTFKIIFVKH